MEEEARVLVVRSGMGVSRLSRTDQNKCHPRALAHSGLSIAILPLLSWFKCILVIH